MAKGKIYVCKRLRLLCWLMDKGFEPFASQPDMDNPHYKVWLFREDEEGKLQQAVTDYYNRPYFKDMEAN